MSVKYIWLLLLPAVIVFSACKQKIKKDQLKMTITKTVFGKLPDGETVNLYTLDNMRGMEIKITNYGGIVTSVRFPDRNGKAGNLVLGFDKLEDYLAGHPNFGSLVGRYANRISGGHFKLDGNDYYLNKNNLNNHLHGGEKGFDKVLWDSRELRDENSVGVELTYISVDGEEGYPGNLQVRVVYKLTRENELDIYYEAVTDKPTVINLTHHSYFNLNHDSGSTINDHELCIYADRYTPVNAELIPTGEMKAVKGSPLDFTGFRKIGERIDSVEGGYDHNFILNKPERAFGPVASIREPVTGRTVDVFSTEPGVQLYTGNFLDGAFIGHGEKKYKKHFGVCLETQHFPDSPNQPSFPSVVLRPGEKYKQHTVYRFGVRQW